MVPARFLRGATLLYDSTLRILDAILVDDPAAFEYDVLPGITAISALTARHRIVLNGIGEPVLITTGAGYWMSGPAQERSW